MSNNLSPRVRAYRDALRADRQRREEANGARTNPSAVDPWRQKSKDDEWEPQIQGVNDTPAAPSGNSSDPFAADDGFGPRADSQAKAGGDLHAILENTPEDIMQEAAERSLEEHRNEGGAAAARTRAAAAKLVGEIRNANITRVCREFLGREPRYVADDDGLNWAALQEQMVADYCPGALRVDDDDTEIATEYLFSHGHLTLQNMLASFQRLWETDGLPVVYEGQRSLSASERRSAMVMAAGGRLEDAITTLLRICLPSIGDATTEAELYAIISREENRPVIADAVLSCWSATPAALQANFRFTPENCEAILDVIGPDRPITVQNVVAAWHQVVRSRAPRPLQEQSAAAANRAPSVDDLESLSDSEVSDLLGAVTRDRARSTRRIL